jgi:site-specific DNA recombinase
MKGAATMTERVKPIRCAIYTRKSTEHNLDLEFNSLSAQREACEAYIKSQAHEGWRLIPAQYDDGAFSGASLERPALQELLSDIETGKIDTVVVYKVDRLTRSLTDFAKLVELFDAQKVSFVSITQSFNTTTSMGRLTLNVLLSFAQFEREVIGERVRDKIAASKRKGLWVGGPVPLGYASVNKKLVVVPEEAETVRTIFRRYLEVGSVGALIEDLEASGIHTKRRKLKSGKVVGGGRFGVGGLASLLRNRFYIGEVVYRGETHRGEHEPILDRSLFDAVQEKLSAGRVTRNLLLRTSPALLMGKIFDASGNRMTPSHSNKRGVRYRYYVSQAVLQRKSNTAGALKRVSAPEIEGLVVKAIRERVTVEIGRSTETVDDREMIEQHVSRVIVKTNEVEIALKDVDEALDYPDGEEDASEDSDGGHRKAPVLRIPWMAPSYSERKGVTYAPSERSILTSGAQEALLTAIAKGRAWMNELVEGRASSFEELAAREGKGGRHARLVATLAFLSPECVQMIANGPAANELTVRARAKTAGFLDRAKRDSDELK